MLDDLNLFKRRLLAIFTRYSATLQQRIPLAASSFWAFTVSSWIISVRSSVACKIHWYSAKPQFHQPLHIALLTYLQVSLTTCQPKPSSIFCSKASLRCIFTSPIQFVKLDDLFHAIATCNSHFLFSHTATTPVTTHQILHSANLQRRSATTSATRYSCICNQVRFFLLSFDLSLRVQLNPFDYVDSSFTTMKVLSQPFSTSPGVDVIVLITSSWCLNIPSFYFTRSGCDCTPYYILVSVSTSQHPGVLRYAPVQLLLLFHIVPKLLRQFHLAIKFLWVLVRW